LTTGNKLTFGKAFWKTSRIECIVTISNANSKGGREEHVVSSRGKVEENKKRSSRGVGRRECEVEKFSRKKKGGDTP